MHLTLYHSTSLEVVERNFTIDLRSASSSVALNCDVANNELLSVQRCQLNGKLRRYAVTNIVFQVMENVFVVISMKFTSFYTKPHEIRHFYTLLKMSYKFLYSGTTEKPKSGISALSSLRWYGTRSLSHTNSKLGSLLIHVFEPNFFNYSRKNAQINTLNIMHSNHAAKCEVSATVPSYLNWNKNSSIRRASFPTYFLRDCKYLCQHHLDVVVISNMYWWEVGVALRLLLRRYPTCVLPLNKSSRASFRLRLRNSHTAVLFPMNYFWFCRSQKYRR